MSIVFHFDYRSILHACTRIATNHVLTAGSYQNRLPPPRHNARQHVCLLQPHAPSGSSLRLYYCSRSNGHVRSGSSLRRGMRLLRLLLAAWAAAAQARGQSLLLDGGALSSDGVPVAWPWDDVAVLHSGSLAGSFVARGASAGNVSRALASLVHVGSVDIGAVLPGPGCAVDGTGPVCSTTVSAPLLQDATGAIEVRAQGTLARAWQRPRTELFPRCPLPPRRARAPRPCVVRHLRRLPKPGGATRGLTSPPRRRAASPPRRRVHPHAPCTRAPRARAPAPTTATTTSPGRHSVCRTGARRRCGAYQAVPPRTRVRR